MKYLTHEAWQTLGTPEQRQEWARQLPLAWILEYRPTILLPGKGFVPLEPWPFQQDFLKCRERFRAINKPRQCGISTIAAAEAAWEFDNLPGAQIVIISKDKDAAVNFHKYVYNILRSVRKNNPKAPKLVKENERETTNENGARIVSLAAGKEAGRSFSATHLYFDELAFAQYAEDIWQAASATLAQTKGRVTAISTPKGKANLFFTIFDSPPQKDLAGKLTGLNEMGFKTFSYGWWDVPTYNPFYHEYIEAKEAGDKKMVEYWIDKARSEGEWYRSERPKYTPLAWKQEFEGAFDAHKGAVFSTRSLERVFRRNYLRQIDDPDRLITEWWSLNEDAKPEKNRLYYTGIDLGRKGDATVILTYDVTDFDPRERDSFGRITAPAKVVDYKWIEPGTLEWSEIERIAKTHLKMWQPESQHDGSGTGDSFSEAVYGYSDPFVFTKESKRNTVTTVQHAFDYAAVMLPKIARLYREHQKYEWDDDDIVQDTVMANALAIPQFYDGGAEIILGFEKVDFMSEAVPA
jgi:hypothetical protein